jgi:ketosteroid isomerase-like protein
MTEPVHPDAMHPDAMHRDAMHPDAAASPREVIEGLLRATVEGRRDETVDFYAADAVIEMPFAPPGMPASSQGRENLRSRMKAAEGLWEFSAVDHVHLHPTADPEVIVAEYRIHGRVTATGRQFAFSYIMVSRIRDGQIVYSRDYFNPLDSAAALGRAPELLASVLGQTS